MPLRDFKYFNECIYNDVKEEAISFIHDRYRWKKSSLARHIIKIEIKELIYSLLKEKYEISPKIYKNIKIQTLLNNINSYGYHNIDIFIYYHEK